jgi:EpsI family protein
VIAGQAATTEIVSEALLPLLWIATVWASAGRSNARRLASAIGYFYFAIPIWDVLNGTLQRLTVTVVSWWLRGANVPAHLDGNFIHLPLGTFEVAGGCAGLSFLIVSLALAALGGVLYHHRWVPRLALVLVAVLLALFANWLRVFSVVMAGYLTDMQSFLVVKDHYYFGWVLFFVCLSPLWWVDSWLQRRAVGSEPGAIMPRTEVPMTAPSALVVVLTGMVLTAGGGFGQWLAAAPPPSAARAIDLPPVESWKVVEAWNDSRLPVFVGPTAAAAGWYARGDARVGVYVADYAVQRQEHEVVFYQNRPQGPEDETESGEIRTVSTAAGPVAFVELATRTAGGAQRLVWVSLRVAGHFATGDLGAKVWQAAGVLFGRRDAQVIVLTADCAASCRDAGEVLSEFAAVAVVPLYDVAEIHVGREAKR